MAQWIENNVLHLDIDMLGGSDLRLDVELVGGGSGRLPYYPGEYEVEPRKVEQTLETKNRSMKEDVIVHPIFYAETSNISGGLTAVIGME